MVAFWQLGEGGRGQVDGAAQGVAQAGQGVALSLEHPVVGFFQAFQAASVQPGEAQHMASQGGVGIEALGLHDQPHPF